MRISDWSSDVCSSDLPTRRNDPARIDADPLAHSDPDARKFRRFVWRRRLCHQARHPARHHQEDVRRIESHLLHRSIHARLWPSEPEGHQTLPHRSEEQTSELQSLMPISYAVFCLKKKTKKKTTK